jgi:hypothetical protein
VAAGSDADPPVLGLVVEEVEHVGVGPHRIADGGIADC